MKKIGVFIGRMQPIHNGHISLIKKILEENDEGLVVIGSSTTLNERNPIPASFRKELIENSLSEEAKQRLKFLLLPDLTSESDNSHDWGFYLYSHIVKEINQHCFTIYYSDGWEIITKWFPSFILQNNIDLRLIARNNCEKGISATKVRDMIVNEDPHLAEVVPPCVFEKKDILKAFINVWN